MSSPSAGLRRSSSEAGFDRDVPQGDGQDKRPPKDLDGIIIASLAARGPERLEELVIGDRLEEGAEGLERRGILEGVPGEERLGEQPRAAGRFVRKNRE